MKWAYVTILAVAGIGGWQAYGWYQGRAEMREIKQISDAAGGVQGGQEWQDLAKRMQEQRMQADRKMMQFQQEQDDTNAKLDRLIDFLQLYPVDLRVGIMKDIKSSYPVIYDRAIENEAFVEACFAAYGATR